MTSYRKLIFLLCILHGFFEVHSNNETEARSADTDTAPKDTEVTPTYTDPKPTDTEATPTGIDLTLTGTDLTPTGTDLTPTEIKASPTDTYSTPTDTETTPTGTEATPTYTEATPTYTEATPTNTESTPTDNEGTPTDNEGTPTYTEATSTGTESTGTHDEDGKTSDVSSSDYPYSSDKSSEVQNDEHTEVENTYSNWWYPRFSMYHSQTFHKGGSDCFEVKVPEMSARYSLSVTLSARITTADAEIERQMKIRIYREQEETYIQTDKPKYSAGQEVKFRMLSIKSPSLKVVKNNIPSIWIEAPNDIRVRQWVDVKADEGLVDLQMLLSDEPILGTWTIKAMVADRTVTQTFVVEEYVLPKFEILIDTPSSIYVRDETFKVKVCGMYTYGQPVRGSVNFTVCFRHSRDDCNPETTVVKYAKDTGSDGCGEFDLTSEELKWDRPYYYYYERQKLSVNANFTEAGTDITLTSSTLSTTIKTTAVQIEITGISYYKPGIEYNGKVFIKNVDGSPANGINTTIHIQEKRESDVIHVFNSFSNKGVVTFSFDAPIDTAITSLLITVTAEGYKTQTYEDVYGYYRIRNNPSNTKTISAFYSPSGSFLNIKPVPNEINFGGSHTFDVDYTIPTGANKTINVKYMVIARAAVATFGSLEVKMPSCSRQEKRSLQLIWPTYDYFISRPEDESVIGLKPLPPTCQFSFKLPIDVNSKMSPDAKLLIYYAREDGEIVADSIKFKVVRGLSNQVKLQFEENMTRPGDKTILRVQSSSNSLCAIGIVDKSVELLGTTNQITNDKVFNSLTNYSYQNFYYTSKCTRSLFINKRSEGTPTPPPPPKRGHFYQTIYVKTKHLDSATVFLNAGVAFTTSLDVETRPCYEITEHNVEREDEVLEYVDQEKEIEENPTDEVEVKKEEPAVNIRTYFPETLLWQIKRTREEDGIAKFDLKVPDTITDWKANGFCISPDSDIGIGETTTLRAFKPFFVSLTLPYSVIRNESVPLKATVFNYLADQCLMVKLELKESSNFTTLGNDFTRKVCVCGGGSKTVHYRIVPHSLGHVPMTVSAVTKGFSKALGRRMCDGEPDRPDKQYIGLTDGVQRDVLVEPEGIEKDETQSSVICLSSNEANEKASYKVNFPENIVPGSDRVKLQLIGRPMFACVCNKTTRTIRNENPTFSVKVT
ncbi:pregnancy zone protein-like [Antedon mediterranea]|uniref:pregnancy zone protein-like n=1 Tax=Antedon mediterranea TaxID=105859 RepID=UPI003AF98441